MALFDWIPKYIKQVLNRPPRYKVTAKEYNELFNLLIEQGDHNAMAIDNLRDESELKLDITDADTTYATKAELQNVILGQLPETPFITEDMLTFEVATQENLNTHLAEKAKIHTNTGTANALVFTTGGDFTYSDGNWLMIRLSAANTGAVTVNVDGKGVKSLKNPDGTDLVAGDIETIHMIAYDAGNDFFVLRPSGAKLDTIIAAIEAKNAIVAEPQRVQNVVDAINNGLFGIGDKVAVADGITIETVIANIGILPSAVDDDGNFYAFNTTTKMFSKFDKSGSQVWSVNKSTKASIICVEQDSGYLYCMDGYFGSPTTNWFCISKSNGSTRWENPTSNSYYWMKIPRPGVPQSYIESFMYAMASGGLHLISRSNGTLLATSGAGSYKCAIDAAGRIYSTDPGYTRSVRIIDYSLASDYGYLTTPENLYDSTYQYGLLEDTTGCLLLSVSGTSSIKGIMVMQLALPSTGQFTKTPGIISNPYNAFDESAIDIWGKLFGDIIVVRWSTGLTFMTIHGGSLVTIVDAVGIGNGVGMVQSNNGEYFIVKKSTGEYVLQRLCKTIM